MLVLAQDLGPQTRRRELTDSGSDWNSLSQSLVNGKLAFWHGKLLDVNVENDVKKRGRCGGCCIADRSCIWPRDRLGSS